MCRFDSGHHARIIGNVWDANLITEYLPLETLVTQETSNYSSVLASNDHVVGTLLLRWPNLAPSSRPVKHGTVDTAASGAVTRDSGDRFDSSMNGQAITISGVGYTVASVTDADHLTLTSNPGDQAAANYHT
jgi:superoxide dismutase